MLFLLITNIFNAGGSISIQGESLYSKGSSYEAKNSLDIQVQKDYFESGAQNSFSYSVTETANHQAFGFIPVSNVEEKEMSSSLKYSLSNLKAGHISIQAKGNITMLGTKTHSQTHTQVKSFGETTIASLKDSFHHTYEKDASLLGGLFKDKTQDDSLDLSVQKNSLESLGDFNINSKNNLTLEGSEILSQGNVSLKANKNVSILNAFDSHKKIHSEQHQRFKGFVFDINESGLDAGVAFDYQKSKSFIQNKQVIAGSIYAGGNLDIISENKDIAITSSVLQAGGETSLDAQGNISILSAQNTSTIKSDTLEGELQVTAHIGNAYVDAGMAGYALGQSIQKLQEASKQLTAIQKLYDQGEASKQALDEAKVNVGFASVNVTSSSLSFNSAMSAAATAATSPVSFGTGFYGSINTTLKAQKQHREHSQTSSLDTSIIGNGDIRLNARGSIDQTGGRVLSSKGNITYDAKGNIAIKASFDTQTSFLSDQSIQNTLQIGSAGVNERVGGGYSQSSLQEVSYTDTTIKASKGKVSFSTKKDIDFSGVHTEGEKIVLKAENFALTSIQGDLKSHHQGINGGIALGGNVTGIQNGGFTLRKDKGWEEKNGHCLRAVSEPKKLSWQSKRKQL